MVRMKQRYILCEIVTADEKHLVYPWKHRDIYNCIRQAIITYHGDYGIGVIQSSLSIKYLNEYTRMAMIRVKRGLHQMVLQALTFIKKIGSTDCFFRTLHVGGTIRSCEKFLVKHHFWLLPRLFALCTTPADKQRLELSMDKSIEKLHKTRITQ